MTKTIRKGETDRATSADVSVANLNATVVLTRAHRCEALYPSGGPAVREVFRLAPDERPGDYLEVGEEHVLWCAKQPKGFMFGLSCSIISSRRPHLSIST